MSFAKHTALASLLAAFVIAGCGGETTTTVTSEGPSAKEDAAASSLPQGSEPADLDPADFTVEIDNPYWPMTPGSRWTYREVEDGEAMDVVVTVTPKTKEIANGVEARVVHDVVSKDGEPLEVTDDYYAQDSAGNIWYLGEDTAEYEHGKVATRAGSFEAGVDGAEAGIALPGDPQDDMAYRQEYSKGTAEDTGEVLGVDEQAEVPFGHFTDVLMTKDLNPLEPRSLELKFYAKGVGPVLTLDASGGSGREDLLDYEPG
jgi:hypothetical protein